MTKQCPTCDGRGVVLRNPAGAVLCPQCNGYGRLGPHATAETEREDTEPRP